MKKIFIKFIILFLFVFISTQIIFAQSSSSTSGGKVFGGRIVQTTATEIKSLEDSGYTCEVPGTSITIKPIKGPASYIIPSGTKAKTGKGASVGKLIIGKYSGKTTVTCTKPCPPPPGNECTANVTLDTITLFGTS